MQAILDWRNWLPGLKQTHYNEVTSERVNQLDPNVTLQELIQLRYYADKIRLPISPIEYCLHRIP